jgi:spore coat protein H
VNNYNYSLRTHGAACVFRASIVLFVLMVLFALLPKNAFAANKPPKAKKTDPSDALFATNAAIRTFKIEVNGPELAALQKDNRAYVRGKVTAGEQTFPEVGIHLKGNGSFRPLNEKPSLVIKFDRFVPDQEFCGLTKISLNSSSQDPTFLADLTANEMFRDAGVPASRVTHARVTFNGRDLGLYVLVEMHNKEFLKRWFGTSQGNLYEAYLADVDSQMDQDHGSDTRQNDRKRFAEVVKIPDATERWTRLPEVLDVDRYVSHLVCELFTSHTDGYAMNRNNYRIYYSPDTDKFTFLGHGVDWAFANTGIDVRNPPQNALVTKALITAPEGQRLYRQRLGTLFTNVFRLEVLTNRVNVAVGRLVAHANSPNETKDFLRYGTDMNNRLVARWQNITNQLYGPPPISVEFDSQGIARLNGWRKKVDRNSAAPSAHEQTTDGSHRVLRISCTNGPCIASWRTKIALPPGVYLFEGDARATGVTARTNEVTGFGAGLRISQGKRDNKLEGDAPWTRVRHNFTNQFDEVELICELRAMKGDVWFDTDSLRLVRANSHAAKNERD